MNELNFFQSWLHRTLQRMADSVESWGQRLEQKSKKQAAKQELSYDEKKQEQDRTIKILGQDVKVKRGKGIY